MLVKPTKNMCTKPFFDSSTFVKIDHNGLGGRLCQTSVCHGRNSLFTSLQICEIQFSASCLVCTDNSRLQKIQVLDDIRFLLILDFV